MINKTENINTIDYDNTLIIKKHENDFMLLIRSRLGIVIKSHQIDVMCKTILSACSKFNCTPEYYLDNLINCRDDSPYLEYLVTGITIGETYFFRDSHQMKLLQEIILPTIINLKRKQNNYCLRIWSAGCATGEEIYTIAMLLSEMLPDYPNWTLQLLGTDINTISLRKAMDGVYNEWSMRSISEYYKKRYFSLDMKRYYLDHNIRQLVNFSYLNLNDDTYPSIFNNTNAQDIILCRNVLIYLDSDRINKLMKKFDTCLVEDAFLLLGASDPINVTQTNLNSYRHEAALLVHSHTIKDDIDIKRSGEVINKISFALPQPIPIRAKEENNKATPKTMVKKYDAAPLQDKMNTMLNEGRWEDIIKMIDEDNKKDLNSIFILNAKATALANLGRLDSAIETCHVSLLLDKTNIYTYFTLAMILSEQNQVEKAEQALRKSLFLDHQFVAGHFQLGLLLIRNKRTKEGLKCLNNALTITLSKNPTENVQGFKGFDYAKLAEILKRQIELYAA